MPSFSLRLALCLCCCALGILQSLAQGGAVPGRSRQLLPFREAGLWGFANDSGQVLLPPTYDAVGSYRAGHWPVEKGGRVGALDAWGNLVLPLQYDYVRPQDGGVFAVKRGDSLYLAGAGGALLFADNYSFVRRLREPYYLVGRGELRGLEKRGAGLRIPVQYRDLQAQWRGQGYCRFLENSTGRYGLFDLEGRQVFAPDYLDVQSFDDAHFFLREAGEWLLADAQGRVLHREAFGRLLVLNSQLVAVGQESSRAGLFHVRSRRHVPLRQHYARFQGLPSGYLIGYAPDGRMGLLDSVGGELLPPHFEGLSFVEGGFVRVMGPSGMGIYDLRQRRMGIAPSFERVMAVGETPLWLAEKPGEARLYGPDFRPLLDSSYQHIAIEGDFVKAFAGKGMSLFRLRAGGLEKLADYDEVHTLHIGYTRRALAEDDGSGRAQMRGAVQARSFADQPAGDFTWRYVPARKRWGLYAADSSEVLPPIYRDVQNAPALGLTLVAGAAGRHDCPLAQQLPVLKGHGALPLALYSHAQARFVTGFELLGLRFSDFEQGSQWAAFIDTAGLFGLLSREGGQWRDAEGQPQRASYIGPLRQGCRAVALGGAWQRCDEAAAARAFLRASSLLDSFFMHFPETQWSWVFNKDGLELGPEARWGYLADAPTYLLPPQFEQAQDFWQGVARCRRDGLWGLIDTAGRAILPFEYNGIEVFHADSLLLKLSKKDNRPLYFLPDGRLVLAPPYRLGGPLRAGLRPVRQDSLWGYADRLGKLLVPCTYLAATPFADNGLALVMDADSLWHMMDTSGQAGPALPDIEQARAFGDNGLAPAKKGKAWGYIDALGDWAIGPRFHSAFPFEAGRGRVVMHKKTGLIGDNGGYTLLPKDYGLLFPPNAHGLSVVQYEPEGPKGLLNAAGTLVLPVAYQTIGPFREGYAVVKGAQGYGLVDSLGQWCIPAEQFYLDGPQEGLLCLRREKGAPLQFVRPDGEPALPYAMLNYAHFRRGQGIVHLIERDTYVSRLVTLEGELLRESRGLRRISQHHAGTLLYTVYSPPDAPPSITHSLEDPFGQPLSDLLFTDAGIFDEQGRIPLCSGTRWGLFDAAGFLRISQKFLYLEALGEDLLLAQGRTLQGICRLDGQIVLPVAYDALNRVPGLPVYRVERGDAVGYIRDNGTWLLPIAD